MLVFFGAHARVWQMTEKEYSKLKERIEREYKDKLRALDLVWELSRNTSSNGKIENRSKKETNGGRGQLLIAIREGLAEIHGQFSVHHIEEIIRKRRPELAVQRSSISGALKRFVDNKEIEIVEAGSGKRPSVYQKAVEDK